jgi:hypothetical protein
VGGWSFSPTANAFKIQGALAVKFQKVVVHSVENCEAEVASNRHLQETEWTITIMLD